MTWHIGARSVLGMRHSHHITIRSIATAGLVTAAMAAPAHATVARDPATASWTPTGTVAVDLRSPDASDAGRPVAVDLRSPDSATPVALPAARPTIVAPQAGPSDGGFDILSALIGAGVAILLAMGAVALMRTRRHHVAPLGS
jgi:hypothetical protein